MAYVGCQACGKTIVEGTNACPHCGGDPRASAAPLLDEFALMQDMTDTQRVLFQR